MLISRHRRRHAAATADDGFTLVELMVTMFVISSVLLGLIGVQVQALQTVGLAKQRQQATALANRTMEQLRALPYDTVSGGLNSSDLAGDPNIQVVAGVQTFKPQYDSSISEVLQTSTGQAAAPLYPHTQDAATPLQPTRIGNVQYRVRTYVSRVDPLANKGFHLTVIVDWSSAVTKGATKTTAVRSQVFSPAGCSSSSTATRPFAGPCQAFFYSDAGTSPAGINVAPVVDGSPLLQGRDVVGLEAKLPGISVRTQSEQIVSAQSVVSTSEAVIKRISSTDTYGGNAASSAADTDPASGVGSAPATASTVAYSDASSASHDGFTVRVPSSASGSTYSTTAAATSPACTDASGTALVTNQACSTGQITPSGTYGAEMRLDFPARDLGDVILARIETPGATPWRAFGARAALPVAGHCSGTSGIGCVAAGAQRVLGATQIGTLPAASTGDSVQPGFAAMVTLDGLTGTARAESGIAPGAAAATRTGTLRYWNGMGMTAVTLGSAGGTYPLAPAVGTYDMGASGTLTIALTGTVEVEPSVPAPTGIAPCQVAACTTTSTVGAVRVTVQYEIFDGTTPIGNFLVNTNLGSTIAQTTYKAAPSA